MTCQTQMQKKRAKIFARQIMIGLCGVTLGFHTTPMEAAHAQTVTVDFSQHAGPPLVKTKFGVYQTPLVTLPRLLNSVELLKEINVQDLRYEIGWGKSDVLAYQQISGTAQKPVYDFSMMDSFVGALRKARVRPLLALAYCPLPLQNGGDWANFKDMPNDLASWQKINRDYAAHLKNTLGNQSPLYEVWNEPDMPEPNGKMFFKGNANDYARLYENAARGVRDGDNDALIGGPAAAYDLSYLKPILENPIDFASIHGYDNYAVQLDMMRGALSARPDLPIFLTEYASFKELPANGPQSRYPGAMRFFRDVKGLLDYTDVTKVYWAQWLDAGDAPGMGLITFGGHRKAIFNAFKVYGSMPADRKIVQLNDAPKIDALASSDAQRASVVLWNSGDSERNIEVHLQQLPFSRGTLRIYRIDKGHSSYLDNPISENLSALYNVSLQKSAVASWKGALPAQSVVYLQIDNDKKIQAANFEIGTHVRDYHWFFNRQAKTYADFDARSGTARLGMGNSDFGVAQIGSVIDNPTPRLRVQVNASGLKTQDNNSLLGMRIDFASKNGYCKSVLYHDALYNAQRDSVLPWGKGGATADQNIVQKALDNGRTFEIDLARLAPPDWNRKRVILSFMMQNAGKNAHAQWVLSKH